MGHRSRLSEAQPSFDLKESRSAVCCLCACPACPAITAWSATSSSEQRYLTAEVLLSARRGRPARTPFGFLIRALPGVASTKRGESCLSLVGPRIC
jgi:hypothetical protein